MKKKRVLFFVVLLLIGLVFAACAENSPNEPASILSPEPAPVETESSYKDDMLDEAEVDTHPCAYELCPLCGDHYVHEELRLPTPPLHIHELEREWPLIEGSEATHIKAVTTSLSDFETVHTVTYIQWDTEWYASLLIWPDEPVQSVSFLSLGFDDTGEQPYFYTREVLFTVDELLPNHALLLNVAFAHYLIPRGGLVFTDESGVEKRMFIAESMRGGCFPRFVLWPHNETHFADWN